MNNIKRNRTLKEIKLKEAFFAKVEELILWWKFNVISSLVAVETLKITYEYF